MSEILDTKVLLKEITEAIQEKKGKEIVIAFNPRYLIDALKAIDDDDVYIQFISPLTPCIINPASGDNFKYLILPIRVNS